MAEESKLDRLRRERPWLDHLFRAAQRYTEQYGSHYAAAVTYFSVLSLVPMLMIGFAIAGFVLATQPELLDGLKNSIAEAVPGALGDTINDVVNQAVASKGTVGVFGLLGAAYSGLGWMSNLRDALTAQWGHAKADLPFLKTALKDLLALLSLGGALVVSFGLTAVGSGFAHLVLEFIGLDGVWWAEALLKLGTIVLALAANWLVFLWVLAKLPRKPVGWRSAIKGAAAAAIGFEILKQVGTIYLSTVTASPAGAAFGPVIGVLVFANLVAQFLLFITAWTATASENLLKDLPAPPPPAVIRPLVEVHRAPSPRTAVGLVGAGVLLGALFRRR
ncbi:inner membrane protein YhjD [Actinosynnema sp. NPDC047251]|uniref:Ribonuclease n=1 Tax=Saccharothrix espanaensis (strain ATCC 51144 / DSM 44229 / JCM 9112 / NBRC 15066 / NRRL 15764) TaxID=1179773 RepID=K0K3Z4_SACES|nr:inner membrane protein YhjD [Saccharothrix espanaensis]CCH34975.1 Ribonuclease [Saccharothrix espanaensis DSM 44229]